MYLVMTDGEWRECFGYRTCCKLSGRIDLWTCSLFSIGQRDLNSGKWSFVLVLLSGLTMFDYLSEYMESIAAFSIFTQETYCSFTKRLPSKPLHSST